MNVYELLQSENETITPEIACIEISLQTFVKLGKISDKQRISFLKSIYCGEQISSALKKYNDFIRNI
jgi:hypothetical protein